MNIKANLKQMVGDRAFWAAWAAIGLMVVMIIIIGAIYIRPSDLQVPVRYSGFGITHFYRDKWYYEIAFMVFAVLVTAFHTFISARLLEVKGKQFALGFLWLTVVILVIAAVFILAILRVAALSQ